jgi:hypothetical protein
VSLLLGGQGYAVQERQLKAGAQVVVGTPGRVLDHLKQRNLRLDHLSVLILDEADEMLDRGFAPDVNRIIAMTPKRRQTALFSATTPPWVQQTAAKHLENPEIVKSDPEDELEPDIEHVVMEVYRHDKFDVLVDLLKQEAEGTTLVFGRTKHGVRKLGQRLQRMGFNVVVLQGNLTQGQRDVALERAGRSAHRPCHQLRAARDARAIYAPRREDGAYGPLRAGDYDDRGRGPHEMAVNRKGSRRPPAAGQPERHEGGRSAGSGHAPRRVAQAPLVEKAGDRLTGGRA